MSDKNRFCGRRFVLRFSVLLLLSVLLCGTVFAWLIYNKVTRTEDLEVDIPPVIYIRDDNLKEMTSFDLDGLQINKTYTSVFCVAPAFRDAVDYFDLGVIYTENIGMIIDLYPVSAVTDTAGTGNSVLRSLYDESTGTYRNCYFNYSTTPDGWNPKVTYGNWENENPANPEGDLNRGVYKLYPGMRFSTASGEGEDIYSKLNDTRSYRFFILTVTWKEDISEAELEKEADVVYIVSKGTARRD